MTNPVIYGAAWCGDCNRAKFFFKENNIAYEYHDIDNEEGAIDIVRKYNKEGFESIPVVLLADETVLIEPTYEQLAKAFNIN